MRTLITGGAGFVGSHLCDRFLERGDEVICVDNLITGTMGNVEHLRHHERFQFIRHNVSHPLEIDGPIDRVLHFASPASPVDYLRFPIQTLKVGSLGTHNALGLAKAKNARFLLASTSEVYGDPQVHPQREDYWGHVNCVGVRGCFSSDTDVLTRAGWKPFPEVTADDEFLTRRADGGLEYHRPSDVIRQRYVGELIGFRNTKIDLLVTPNHKMLVREKHTSEYRLVEAFQALNWRAAEMQKGGQWSGVEVETFHLPLVTNAKSQQIPAVPLDVWLEFLGYFLSEGCTYRQRKTQTVGGKVYNSSAYLVFISQSKKKPDNREKIRACLERLGFKFHTENAQFRIASKQLYSYLVRFGKARDKFIPRELLDLPPRQLRILFDALMLGDGNALGTKYYSASTRLLGDVQELALKLGMAGSILRKDAARSTYALCLTKDERRDVLTPLYPPRHIEGYDGEVYCVTVPNHTLFVRRNGKAVWCGNCYDESKRFAEAMVMAYHRAHGVDTRIIRIFNSVLGDQPLLAFHDGELVLETADEYAARLEKRSPERVTVPAFDPASGTFGLREASAFIKHPAMNDAFELSLRYGRRLKVTGDHSVFVRGSDGRPVARPVRQLKEGDHVAIPATLPVAERDRPRVDLIDELVRTPGEDLWAWKVRHPDVPALLRARRQEVYAFVREEGRYRALETAFANATGRWIRERCVPLAVLHRLGEIPGDGAEIRPAEGRRFIPARLALTDDVLWLLGFFLAEGCTSETSGNHILALSSDDPHLRKAAAILKESFGGEVGFSPATPQRAPSVWVHCRALCILFDRILGLAARRIPAWVLQLPLSRLKHFLEGFRCGDGTHSGKKLGNELCFDTTREPLAVDLTYALLRFGIVASFGRYETTYRRKYGDRKFPFYRLTVCELDDFDILNWDKGVKQTLNATRYGDLVWAMVRQIRPCVLTGHVYDFSVPGAENFVAGNGVCAHNTYGSRMRLDDGRVLPNFVGQALRGEPLTVYGDGSQTRSFCFVEDLVNGIEKLLGIEFHEPVNLGNPDEVTILEFAREILALSGSKSEIVYHPLPQDDPKVRQPDITRARTLLGWEPRIRRTEGLRRTLEYFQGKIVP